MAVILRRIIRVGIVFSFVLSLFPRAAVKADSPVEISTPAQLNNIRSNLSGSYVLTADIDLGSISNWVPLGSSASPFVGDLDGNGHIIRNLVIANTQSSDLGLFGVIGATGLVSNLQVLNANVTAADNAGILAGSNQGTISRVLTQGIISGANTVGGLVGSNSGIIEYAYTRAEVSGRNMNGGLVGNNSGSINQSYAASQVSKAVTNNYVQFDGIDDYISIPHNPAYITDSFTLEAWFQWTATDRTSVSFITGKGLENFEIHTGGGSGANGIRFIPVVRDDTTYNDSRAYQDVPNVLQPGWNHVAAVWDFANQQVRVFLNGLPQDIYQNGVNVGPVANLPLDHPETNPLAGNTEEFFIGARNDQYYGYPSLFFMGNIADVRFWNIVRTPSQIASDKYKQLSGTESGLIGYWKLDEASGNTVEDSSSLHNDGTLLGDAVRVQEVSVNGGLVAVNTGSVTASYYDSELSGLSDSDKGTPLSTAFMKKSSSYDGWDFVGTWKILEDQTYPSLFDLSVTLEQDSAQSDPTNESAIDFSVVFAEPIDPATFTAADITLGGTAGATTAVITQVAPNDGTTFNIAVSGMTANGTVTAAIAADRVADLVGNLNEASQSTDNSVAYDGAVPTVTLEQDVAQSDPTNESTIDFRVVFAEPIDPATFTAADITLGGTAGATTAVISQVAPNDGTTFNVAVSGMTGNGTVTAAIAAGKVADLVGNLNEASESLDNTVSYDASQLTVSLEQSSTQPDPTNTIPIHFTAVFSKPILVISFSAVDVVLGGTAGADTVEITEIAPNDGTTFDLSVSGLTGLGTVTAAIPEDGVSDPAGNLNAASTGVDTIVTMETTRPDVTVNQADGQVDPTNTQPIHFLAVFSEPILTTSFTAADVVISGGSGSESVLVSEVAPNDGTTFDLAVSGLVDSREISVSISELGVSDLADNSSTASSSTDNRVRYDVSELTVSVEQAVGQPDTTNQGTIHMTLTFNKPITPTALTVDDITLGGSAGANTVTLTEIAPFDGTVFDLQISGMTANGSVTASLLADRVTDPAGNANLISTSVDNLVAYDVSNPIMSQISLKAVYDETGPQEFEIQFNKAMYNPDDSLNDPDDVNNPANYLLISAGTNRQFDTLTCAGGLLPDDNRVDIVGVEYDEDRFTSTIRLAAELPIGSYRLFVCGTTSLLDAALNHLNGGTDTIFNFSVNAAQSLPSNKAKLPATGFAQNQVTVLPSQPRVAYYTDGGQVLVIPSLKVRTEIVGVPLLDDTWDVTWLNQRAGYLYGSAYPTWAGNTVITGHVWDADNTPGIFADLKLLKYGDEIQISANGLVYTYAVRENSRVNEQDMKKIFTDAVYDWVTLVTCEGYDSDANAYPYRRMVRAVLIKVE